MSRFRLLGAAFIASTAALSACTIVDGSADNTSELNDPSTQSCLRDTIEVCYGEGLSPDACASLIEQRCLGGGPGPGDPEDPDCLRTVFEDCVAAGVDEMTCYALANDRCNQDPEPPPWPPECDPSTGMDCEPPRPPECDPNTGMDCEPPRPPPCEDPPPPPEECVRAVFEQCIAAGIDEMTCWVIADERCSQDPNQPPRSP